MTTLRRLPGAPEPMFTVEGADGVTIAGDRWGPVDGAPVLLLHGGGQTRHSWKQLGSSLGEQGYHAISIDLRGHGDTDWSPDGEYGYGVFLADLNMVIDALRLEPPALVGASLGGAVSLAAVGEGLVTASALVIVDTAPQIEPTGVSALRNFMTANPDGYGSLDEAADAIAAFQGRRRPTSTAGLAKNLRADTTGRLHWHWDPRFMGGGPRQGTGAERTARLEAAAQQVEIPTLLVRGGLSNLLSQEGADSFLALCPHSEFISIEGAAHTMAGERNDLFASAVADFLERRLR